MKHTNHMMEEHLLHLRAAHTTRPQFRQSLRKVGEYLGIEMARDLNSAQIGVQTPTGKQATQNLVYGKLALVGLLRAALPLHEGLLDAFPSAESGYIGAKRNEHTLESEISYAALPILTNRTVILADTMLATGGTLKQTIDYILPLQPKNIMIATAIASQSGIDTITKHCENIDPQLTIYAAAIDKDLNSQGYILPGLGDAGDRCYGKSL